MGRLGQASILVLVLVAAGLLVVASQYPTGFSTFNLNLPSSPGSSIVNPSQMTFGNSSNPDPDPGPQGAPEVTIMAPPDNYVTPFTDIVIEVRAFDPVDGIASCTLYFDNLQPLPMDMIEDPGTGSTRCIYHMQGMQNGVHPYYVTATDTIGTMGTSPQQTITVDTSLPIPIYNCMNIIAPGKYTLARDIDTGSQNIPVCINISASNVELDCNNPQTNMPFRINGIGNLAVNTIGILVHGGGIPTASIGVSSPQPPIAGITNVTVKNCEVSWWNTGIKYDGATNSQLLNNRAVNGINNGIYLTASTNNILSNNIAAQIGYHVQSPSTGFGILLDSSSNSNQLNSNTVGLNNYGIFIADSTGNTLTSNIAGLSTPNTGPAGNRFYGIALKSADGNTLTNNHADYNGMFGIGVGYVDIQTMQAYPSNSNVLTNNQANHNEMLGIGVRGDQNTVTGSTISNNGGSQSHTGGLSVQGNFNSITESNIASNGGSNPTGYGIHFYIASGTKVQHNTIIQNANGISFYGPAGPDNSNIVIYNRIFSNVNNDAVWEQYMGGSGNDFSHNHWGRTYCQGLRFGEGAALFIQSMMPYYTDYEMTNLDSNTFCGCGSMLLQSITLTQNLDCSNTGLSIGADGVTLDCAGFSITGQGNGDGVQVALVPGPSGSVGVTIKNCTISNFANGIHFQPFASSTNNNISDNTIFHNKANGIWLQGNTINSHTNSNIIGNTVYDTYASTPGQNPNDPNYGYGGIFLEYSSGNTIAKNNVYQNSLSGISAITSSNSNIIKENSVSNNLYGIATAGSNNNQVYSNSFIDNTNQAFNGGANVFNLPAPTGGNYWSDYHTTAQGCYDANNDNFCDGPYVFTGGQDNLPLTVQPGTMAATMTAPSEVTQNQFATVTSTVTCTKQGGCGTLTATLDPTSANPFSNIATSRNIIKTQSSPTPIPDGCLWTFTFPQWPDVTDTVCDSACRNWGGGLGYTGGLKIGADHCECYDRDAVTCNPNLCNNIRAGGFPDATCTYISAVQCAGTDADSDRYSTSAADANLMCCGSGRTLTCLTGIDCNDTNAAINPGATEVCTNQIDDNCNLAVDCADSSCTTSPACTAKGVIPTQAQWQQGMPFYTTNNNPQTSADAACLANMQFGQSCTVTWQVMTKGDIGKKYTFFTTFTSNTGLSVSSPTQLVTIIQPTQICGNGIIEYPPETCDDSNAVTPVNCGVGACYNTVADSCINSKLPNECTTVACVPGTPTTETCNNIDDNCNGAIDESLTQACYTGPAGTENVGICHGGTQTCSAGTWGICAGEVTPQTEIACNGIDENCNGMADDGSGDSDGDGISDCNDACPTVAGFKAPTEYVLEVQDFKSTTSTVTAKRVFAGNTEVFAAADGKYHIPLKDPSGNFIKDNTNYNTLPKGVWVVDRQGAVEATALGTSCGGGDHNRPECRQYDNMKNAGVIVAGVKGDGLPSNTYVYYKTKATLDGSVVVRNSANNKFEKQGDGVAVKGNTNQDEFTVTKETLVTSILAEASVRPSSDYMKINFYDLQGCPYGDITKATMHIVDQKKSGSICGYDSRGKAKDTCDLPLEGMDVKVYDREDAAFRAAYGSNPNKKLYDDIFEASSDIGLIGGCTTAADGACLAPEAKGGKFLVIGKYTDTANSITVYQGRLKNFKVSDCNGNEYDCDGSCQAEEQDDSDSVTLGVTELVKTKNLHLIKTISKYGVVKYEAGDRTIIRGSELDVISADYVVWEDSQELYPFIMTSDSNWTVDVCLNVPEGYTIAGVMDIDGNVLSTTECLQTFIEGESKVILFELASTGAGVSYTDNAPDVTTTITGTPQGETQRQTSKDIVGVTKSEAYTAPQPTITPTPAPTVTPTISATQPVPTQAVTPTITQTNFQPIFLTGIILAIVLMFVMYEYKKKK